MRQPVKKLSLATVFIIASVAVSAQAKPSYTQYVLNNFALNPAVAGIENYTDIKISNRNQWSNIEGHPVTSYVSIHGPIGKSDYRTSATSFSVPGENPRGKSYWEEYTVEPFCHLCLPQTTGHKNNFIGWFYGWVDKCEPRP